MAFTMSRQCLRGNTIGRELSLPCAHGRTAIAALFAAHHKEQDILTRNRHSRFRRLPLYKTYVWGQAYLLTVYVPLYSQLAYYSFKTRGLRNYFVSFASNVRISVAAMAVVVLCATYSSLAYYMWVPPPGVLAMLSNLYLLMLVCMETFTIPFLKIAMRNLHVSSNFNNVDFATDTALKILKDSEELDKIIASPRARYIHCAVLFSSYRHACEF